MADTPVPLSYEQHLGVIVDGFLSRTGLPRLKIAGPLLSVMEAAAESDAAAGDVLALLASIDPTSARGQALDEIGRSARVPRYQARAATDCVPGSGSTSAGAGI